MGFLVGLLFIAVRGLLFIAVRRLLIVVASLVAEHGLVGVWASVVAARGLTCPAACRIFPHQGWTRVPCIGGWILNHWTTRDVHLLHILAFCLGKCRSV